MATTRLDTNQLYLGIFAQGIAALVIAWPAGLVQYGVNRMTPGAILLGISPALIALAIGLTSRTLTRQTHPLLGVTAGSLAVVASIFASLVTISFASNKSLSLLLSDQPWNGVPGPLTEFDATINTLTNVWQIIAYLIAGFFAYYLAGWGQMAHPPQHQPKSHDT